MVILFKKEVLIIKKILATISLIFLLLFSNITPTNMAQAQTFKDVPEKLSYYNAVENLAKQNIIPRASTFKPNTNITRGEYAKMLATALKLNTKKVKNPKFKDVPTSNKYYPYIAAVANKGLLTGMTKTTFGVNKPLKKIDLASSLVKGFGLPNRAFVEQPYSDIKKGSTNAKYTSPFRFYGLEVHTDTRNFNPNSNAKKYVTAYALDQAMKAKESVKLEVVIPLKTLNFTFDEVEVMVYQSENTKTNYHIDYNNNVIVLWPTVPEKGFLYSLVVLPNGKDRPSDAKTILIDVNSKLKLTYKLTDGKVPTEYKNLQPLDIWNTHYTVREDLIAKAVIRSNAKPSESTVLFDDPKGTTKVTFIPDAYNVGDSYTIDIVTQKETQITVPVTITEGDQYFYFARGDGKVTIKKFVQPLQVTSNYLVPSKDDANNYERIPVTRAVVENLSDPSIAPVTFTAPTAVGVEFFEFTPSEQQLGSIYKVTKMLVDGSTEERYEAFIETRDEYKFQHLLKEDDSQSIYSNIWLEPTDTFEIETSTKDGYTLITPDHAPHARLVHFTKPGLYTLILNGEKVMTYYVFLHKGELYCITSSEEPFTDFKVQP